MEDKELLEAIGQMIAPIREDLTVVKEDLAVVKQRLDAIEHKSDVLMTGVRLANSKLSQVAAESDYEALPIKAYHRIAEAYTVVRYKAVKV